MTSQQVYNFQVSNVILMVGGQVLFFGLIIMVLFFGTPIFAFPADSIKKIMSNDIASSAINSISNSVKNIGRS